LNQPDECTATLGRSVVQPDVKAPSGANPPSALLEAESGVTRVMQHPRTPDEIEVALPERRRQEVPLDIVRERAAVVMVAYLHPGAQIDADALDAQVRDERREPTVAAAGIEHQATRHHLPRHPEPAQDVHVLILRLEVPTQPLLLETPEVRIAFSRSL
jgi:hypothetical protein